MFIIPDVHYLYKRFMVCKVQICDNILVQMRNCSNPKNVLSSLLAFFLFPAKEKWTPFQWRRA